MRAEASSVEILRNSVWIGRAPAAGDRRLRSIAACMDEVRPSIVQLSQRHGDRPVIWALTAVVVDMAIEAGNAKTVAALFRNDAEILELVRDRTGDKDEGAQP